MGRGHPTPQEEDPLEVGDPRSPGGRSLPPHHGNQLPAPKERGGGQTSGCLPAAGLETTFSLSLWGKQVEWEGIRVPPHPTDIFLQGRGSQPVEGARAVIWDNQTKQGGCLVWKQGGCLESIPGIKQGTFSGESKPVGCSPTGACVLLWACLPPHRVGGWVTTGVGGSLAGAGLGVFLCGIDGHCEGGCFALVGGWFYPTTCLWTV